MVRYTKEEVKEVLDKYKDREIGSIKLYFQAILDERLPEYYLDELSNYRFNYSDETPEPDVPKDHPDYKFLRLQFREGNDKIKCRCHAMIGISASLEGIIEDEILTEQEHIDLINQYKTRDWNAFKGGKGEFWTSPEEISFINSTLDIMIASIKKVYQL